MSEYSQLAYLKLTYKTKAEELKELIIKSEEYIKKMAHTPSIWPTRGRISSYYGHRRSPITRKLEFHRGIDIANSSGTRIRTTADGRVVTTTYRSGWGRLIIIDHGYGFKTYYAHLRGYAVRRGQYVTKGQVIGYMGSTGNTTGAHLHYEVHYNGKTVNPLKYMR